MGVLLACAFAPAAAASQIAVITTGPGALHVLGRDAASGQLMEAVRRGGVWDGWTAIPGDQVAPTSALSAVTMPGGTLHAFYRGMDGRLHRRSRIGTRWTQHTVFSELAVDAGPAAVRRGAAVELVARRSSDGRLMRWTWRPGHGRVPQIATRLRLGVGSDPALSWSGTTLDTAYLPPAPPERRRVAVQSLSRPGTAQPLAGTVVGNPALAGNDARGTWLVVRQPSGQLARRERSPSGAMRGPWRDLGAPPIPFAAGASPVATLHRLAPDAPRTLTTVISAAAPNALLLHQQRTGWQRITLRAATSASDAAGLTSPGLVPTVERPPSGPVGAVAPSPTPGPSPPPTPDPTPEPTPTPTPGPPPPQPSLDGPEPQPAGTIRYFGRTSPEDGWDAWLQAANTPPANRAHLLRNTWRLELFANNDLRNNGALATSWYPGGMVYRQLYTIDADSAAAHPSWVMRDATGAPLYADDGGDAAGIRRLIAGNIFNPAYRAWAISHAPVGGTDEGGLLQTLQAGAFRGLWLDNVNPELLGSGLVQANGTWVGPVAGVPAYAPAADPARPADGSADACPAAGPSTSVGRAITDRCWGDAITTFLGELRAAMPAGSELLANVPWFRTQRSLTDYAFIDEPTPAFTSPPPVPPAEGPLAGGLWTAHGQGIADSSTYLNIEGSFWANARGSGPGAGGAPGAGRSTDGYSLDMLFRYIDAIHRREKGFVADNWVDRRRLGDLEAAGPADDPLLRVQEFNLAGYLLATNGRDGIGDFNPRADTLWPAITGSGGATLYGMDIGEAAERPANLLDPATNADDPGPGPAGRGVAAVGTEGHRLWGRRFVRDDGREVFALLAEPAPTGTPRSGEQLTYRVPGDPQCSNMTRAAQAPYASWDTEAGLARLDPASALLLLCEPPAPDTPAPTTP